MVQLDRCAATVPDRCAIGVCRAAGRRPRHVLGSDAASLRACEFHRVVTTSKED